MHTSLHFPHTSSSNDPIKIRSQRKKNSPPNLPPAQTHQKQHSLHYDKNKATLHTPKQHKQEIHTFGSKPRIYTTHLRKSTEHKQQNNTAETTLQLPPAPTTKLKHTNKTANT
ncbi:hypothetical protein ANN_04031 [Periplaneta americana]|uniref:Uncharacterized protein n=1 Tax=Periplaneta americana TaxID=6978 RepID=A0ABQ8T9B1_PERAM|nr:hypothetical protein ANN_04031 [Periplaneta americana]